jgi:lysyl endopeptidase
VLLLAAAVGGAQSMQGEAWENPISAPNESPLRPAGVAATDAAVSLGPASVDDAARLQQLLDYNTGGAVPMRNGFLRQAPEWTLRVGADIAVSEAHVEHVRGLLLSDGDGVVWTARSHIDDAYAFRIHLADVSLPHGTKIWVYSLPESTTLGPFGSDQVGPGGDLWLPALEGSDIVVEVRLDAEALRRGEHLQLVLGEVMELFDVTDRRSKAWTDCDVDATCVTSGTLSMIDDYYNAVAHLYFIEAPYAYICSGGLVNDTDPGSFIPYLLTANHCFSTQTVASTLVSYFDFRSSVCNGPEPSLGSVPQVSGSTLLASDSISDFTFVQLSGLPSGANYFLGWTANPPAAGQQMHRVAHPAGTAQKYSRGTFNATGGIVCTGVDRPYFHYSSAVEGSTTGGSSGAPVILDVGGGQIVGQLRGKCHYATWDECDYGTFNWIDGAFGTTYQYISGWLIGTIFSDDFESGSTSAWTYAMP